MIHVNVSVKSTTCAKQIIDGILTDVITNYLESIVDASGKTVNAIDSILTNVTNAILTNNKLFFQ